MKKLAVIGGGISGLASAYYLSSEYEVHLFEKENRLGGHTNTRKFELEGREYNIDTGFIVCNDRTYPNFLGLMSELDIELKPSEMSFSVSNPIYSLEYNGHSLNALFADRKNIFNPKFLIFVKEILRFNRICISLREEETLNTTLGYFLKTYLFSNYFSENYILPMVSAIWSCGVRDALDFDLLFFLKFFRNHGLLEVRNRPVWYVLKNGSSSYLEPLSRPFKDNIHLSNAIRTIKRHEEGVTIVDSSGEEVSFDYVIIACHSDQALSIVSDPSELERDLLTSIPYTNNSVILHTDSSILPRNKRAHASWNYRINECSSLKPTLTYNMNILQGLESKHTFCVTVNGGEFIDESKVIESFNYAHPVFNSAAESAKNKVDDISGINRTFYAGAYWRNGFHEDGVSSAISVANKLRDYNE